MAAISTAALALCQPNDSIVYTAPAYGGTEYLFDRILPRYGVTARAIPAAAGAEALYKAMISATKDAPNAAAALLSYSSRHQAVRPTS